MLERDFNDDGDYSTSRFPSSSSRIHSTRGYSASRYPYTSTDGYSGSRYAPTSTSDYMNGSRLGSTSYSGRGDALPARSFGSQEERNGLFDRAYAPSAGYKGREGIRRDSAASRDEGGLDRGRTSTSSLQSQWGKKEFPEERLTGRNGGGLRGRGGFPSVDELDSEINLSSVSYKSPRGERDYDETRGSSGRNNSLSHGFTGGRDAADSRRPSARSGLYPSTSGGNSDEVPIRRGYSSSLSRDFSDLITDDYRGDTGDSGGRKKQDSSYTSITSGRNHRDASPVNKDSYRRTDSPSEFRREDRDPPGGMGSRQTSRVVYNGAADASGKERDVYGTSRPTGVEKEFLGKVQRELEAQRSEWKGEIDRLTGGSVLPGSASSFDAVKDSMVDTSSGRPIFKAFVDVSEFPAGSVKVNVDKLTNKVVIEARQSAGGGSAKTFTQRVQLPRYADEQHLVARMNRRGILKVEVPLIYYFPEADARGDGAKAKSFVYEVRTDPVDGTKVMEIIVNPGREVSARDLRVELEGDKLQIWAERTTGGSVGSLSPGGEGEGPGGGRTLIKQYTMPANANVERMKTSRSKDGRFAILIPIL